MQYPIGSIISCEKELGFEHLGMVVGDDRVFHNAPNRGEHLSTLHDFSAGRPIKIKGVVADWPNALARVHARLTSPQGYALLDSNCEHSVSAVAIGRPTSPQLYAALAFTAVMGLLFALVASTRN